MGNVDHQEARSAAYVSNEPGLDMLRTQMQETGSIATGVGFPLPWLLLFLSDLGIDENSVYIDVANGRIEVKP